MRCLIICALLAFVASSQATKSSSNVKTDTAAAHHYQPPRYGYQPVYGFLPPVLQDRFVCDLDASVLLVKDQRRRSYGKQKAVRVKCSDVASYDEKSCNLCCQQTARRDTTMPNNELFGFLAITKTHEEEEEQKEEPTRVKRSLVDDDDEEEEENFKLQATFLNKEQWKPSKYYKNVKCVCCAPKNRPVASYGQAAKAPETYGQAAQAPTTYGQAPQAPTTYGQTPQAPTTYGQAPQAPETYGQAPQAPTTYGQAPQAPTTYGQAPQAPPTYNQPPVNTFQDKAAWGAAKDAPPAAPSNTY